MNPPDARQIPLFAELPRLAGKPPPATWRPPTELPSLGGARRVAVDVETCDPELSERGPGVRRGGYVVGIGVAVEGGGRWYLPFRHGNGRASDGNLDPDLVLRWARSELNALDGELVGANLIYDLDYLAHLGVTFPRVKRFLDVQVAEPLLDEHRLQYNLDALALDYLGEGKVEGLLREAATAHGFGESNRSIKQNLWRLPAAYVGPYGEGDVDAPLRILRLQEKRLAEEGLTELFDLESRLIPVLLAMRRRGVRVDVEGALRVRERLVAERDAALAEVRRLAGPRAELLAPDSFAAALTERNLTVPLTPKTRQPSITKEWLARHRGDALVDAISAGRRVGVIISTFIDGAVLGHAVNGRVHCEFNQLKRDDGGTIARFSSSSPNLQNIPSRDEEIGPLVRGLFQAEEDEEWARLDESQIEYRFLVHFARGPGADEARRAYREKPETDFHKLCTSMAGKDPEDKHVRKKMKNVNFCKVYGGGVAKIAATMGCSVEEAGEFVALYEEKLPFVKKTLEAASKAALRNGEVRTILKRKQRFVLWEPRGNWSREHEPLPREAALERYGEDVVRAYAYAALNRVLQGSAADLLKKAMVDAWEAGVGTELGAYLVTVHDELGVSVAHRPAAREALAELKRHMEVAIPLRVPVIAELELGKTWGDCK